MKDLSIVIRASENKIYEYIHLLEPILSDYQSELIIINNTAIRFNIKYEYTLYKYYESHDKFKEFCFSSSSGSRVIIIDGNIGLNSDIISDVMNQLRINEFGNVAYNFKKFLALDDSLYYMDNQVLIYSRGIKGFNTQGQIIIDDFTLVDEEYKEINPIRLLRHRSYNELYLWYKQFILKYFPDFEQRFYEILEFEKTKLDEDDIKGLEKAFIACNDNPRYRDYLIIKEELHLTIASDHESLSDRISAFISLKDDSLNAWLIYMIIKERKDLLMVIYKLDLNQLKRCIEYLSKYTFSHELLYDLILGLIHPHNEDDEYFKITETNLMLLKNYIIMASEFSASPYLKAKLLKVFEQYKDTFIELLTNGKNSPLSPGQYPEEAFIMKFQIASDYIKQNDINKACIVLKELCAEYPSFNMVLRYYIQRLRYQNNSYPFNISICMIVKDEEKNLNRCLSSLKPLLNNMAELIIVDTGSVDKTVEIAKRYTKNVFFYKWKGSFSDARNYSLSIAEGEYIFLMDADEEFEKTEIQKLVDAFSALDPNTCNTYTLKIKNYTDIQLKEYAVLTQARVFRNNCEFYYSGNVHNQPIFKAPVKHLAVTVTHYGYIMTEDIKDKKFQRTANMLKSELQKNPQNIYYRFQLSTSYAMHGELKEALKQADIYMKRISEESKFSQDYLMHYNNAALLYISSNRFEKASEICDDALKISPDFIDFIYYKALIYNNTGEHESALEYTNRYLALIDNFLINDIANDGRYSFYTLGMKNDVLKMQILCNYRMGQYNEIVNTIRSFSSEAYTDCLHAIINAYINTQRYSDLIRFYNTCCSDTKSKLIFRYFVEDSIHKSSEKVQLICRGVLSSLDYHDSFFEYNELNQVLLVVENYDVDSLNLNEAKELFNKLLPVFTSLQIEKTVDINEIYRYKRFAQFVLHRSSQLARYRDYSVEKLINILRKYMSLASTLIRNKRTDLLEGKEQLFLIKITEAFKQYGAGNYENTVKLLKESVEKYSSMEGLIKLILKTVIPGYKPENYIPKFTTIITNEKENIESYAVMVRRKIIEAANTDNGRNVLEVFKQFDNRELYDPELFSIKSVLLMSEAFYNDSETELFEGLKRYPNDTHLLSSLSRLYSLTNECTKSLETFCRVKILSQGKCSLEINELFPYKTDKDNSEIPKVLHGTMFGDDSVNKIANELSKRGIYTKTLNYCPKYTGYTSDYVINMNQYETGNEILSKTAYAASKLIPEFNIFHFHYGSSLTFDSSDLPLLKELGKKIVVHFWGDELKPNGKVTKEKLQRISGYASCCIVQDDVTCEYVKEYFEKAYVIKPDEIDNLVDLYKGLI